MSGKNKLAVVVAEFLGTAVLAYVVLAISRSNVGIPYFISFAAGLTLAIGVFSLARVSGAMFNPAITLGLWTVGRVKTTKAIVAIVAQLLGGFAAYQLYSYVTGATWENSESVFKGTVFAAEIFGAFVFAFGVAAAMYQRIEGGAKAAVIGGSLAIGIIAASSGSFAMINPAIALAAHSWIWSTYVAGPIIGAIVGFNLYSLLFAPADEVGARFGVVPRKFAKEPAVPEEAPGNVEVPAQKSVAKVAKTTTKKSSTKKSSKRK